MYLSRANRSIVLDQLTLHSKHMMFYQMDPRVRLIAYSKFSRVIMAKYKMKTGNLWITVQSNLGNYLLYIVNKTTAITICHSIPSIDSYNQVLKVSLL